MSKQTDARLREIDELQEEIRKAVCKIDESLKKKQTAEESSAA